LSAGTRGAYSAPPDHLAGFKWPYLQGDGMGEGKDGRGIDVKNVQKYLKNVKNLNNVTKIKTM